MLAKILLMTALAYGFGASHAMGELLHRGGYRWFPRAEWLAPLAAAGFGVGMLYLAHPTVYVAFLAVLGSWALSGRLFAFDGAVIAAGVLGFVWTQTPILAVDPLAWPYFAATMIGAAGLGWWARRGTGPVASATLHLLEARYHWYAIGAGYAFLFELDSPLFLSLYGFMSGAAAVSTRARTGQFQTWGLKRVTTSG